MKLGLYEVGFANKNCTIKYISTTETLIDCTISKNNLFIVNKEQLMVLSMLEQYSQEVFYAKVHKSQELSKLRTNSTVTPEVTRTEFYSKEQILRAKQVILLHNALDHPSNHVFN
jgi:hypothetical protein